MANYVIANMLERPTRTVVSVLAVAVAVVLVLTTIGLSQGILKDSVRRTQSIGADIIFQPTGASILFALSAGTMPLKLMERMYEVEGVEAIAPVLSHFSARDFGLIFGIEPQSFARLGRGLGVVEGSWLAGPDDVVVDDAYARANRVKLGDTLELFGGRKFRVVGIVRSGAAAVRIFVQLGKMQELRGAQGQASMFFVKVRSGAEVDQVYRELRRKFPGYTITKSQEIMELLSSSLPGLKEFTMATVFISALVSFLVILLAMYTSIFERTREIGMLKSLGASKLFIFGQILKESLLIAALGIGVGYAITFLIRSAMTRAFPTLIIEVTPDWLLNAALIGLFGATLGAFYPAYMAARQDPVDALSYE